jgi:hypothetical protein
MAVSKFVVHLENTLAGGPTNPATNTFEFDSGLGGQSVAYTVAKLVRFYEWMMHQQVMAGETTITRIVYYPIATTLANTVGSGFAGQDVVFPVAEWQILANKEGMQQVVAPSFPAVMVAATNQVTPRGCSMVIQRKGASIDGQGSGRIYLPFLSANSVDSAGVISQAVGQAVAAILYRYLKGSGDGETPIQPGGPGIPWAVFSSDPVIQGKKAGIVPIEVVQTSALVSMLQSRKR